MKKFILLTLVVSALSGCALEGNRYYPPVSVNNGNDAAQTMHYGPPVSSNAANSMHYGTSPAYPPVTVTNSDNAADSMHYGNDE